MSQVSETSRLPMISPIAEMKCSVLIGRQFADFFSEDELTSPK